MPRPKGSPNKSYPTSDALLDALEQNDGEIDGTERLLYSLDYSENCKQFILKVARRLAEGGHITITKSNGGRGLTTCYRRIRVKGQP